MAKGTIYLIHLDRPFGSPDPEREARGRGERKRHYTPHLQHYLGWALDLDARLEQHRSLTVRNGNDNGARVLIRVNQAGIQWRVVRTWTGTRHLEAALKKLHNHPALCPVCNPDGWERNGAGIGRRKKQQ